MKSNWEKICSCRGNLNANNPELPCSSCGGVNPKHSLLQQARQEERETVRKNIGQLRQWLNERNNKDLITDKEIEHWLFSDPKKEGIK